MARKGLLENAHAHRERDQEDEDRHERAPHQELAQCHAAGIDRADRRRFDVSATAADSGKLFHVLEQRAERLLQLRRVLRLRNEVVTAESVALSNVVVAVRGRRPESGGTRRGCGGLARGPSGSEERDGRCPPQASQSSDEVAGASSSSDRLLISCVAYNGGGKAKSRHALESDTRLGR